jgi:large subunit ribosomal protein L35
MLYFFYKKLVGENIKTYICNRFYKTSIKSLEIMPKVKTHSGAKKRFKVTGTGKIKRNRAGKRHILTKKSKKRKLQLSHSTICAPGDAKRVEKMLNI